MRHFWSRENNKVHLNREAIIMSTSAKKTSAKEKEYNLIITEKIRSYADEPFFVKKEEKAKEFLLKNLLPDHLKK